MTTPIPQLFPNLPVVMNDDWPDDYEAVFWDAYPRRVSKISAMKALEKVRRGGDVSWGKLINAVQQYSIWLGETGQGWRPGPKHPATWLNGGGWDDELPRQQQNGTTFADIVMQRYQK